MQERAEGGMRCYLHIGTHKTGTTAIQWTLRRHSEQLRQQNVLYPQAGIPKGSAGHHNLVFELLHDSRFDADDGTFADLENEVRRSKAATICLSSEAFEYVHDQPASLDYVKKTIAGLGYRGIVVIYVRPQAPYAESLFAELTKHHHTGTLDAFLNEVIRTGSFRAYHYGCTETFTFKYEEIAQRFADCFGRENVIVRRYHEEPGWVVRDFFSLIAGGTASASIPVDISDSATLINRRPSVGAVLRNLYQNVEQVRALGDQARAFLRLLEVSGSAVDGAPFSPLGTCDLLRLLIAFAYNNDRLKRRWGVSLPVIPARQFADCLLGTIGARSEQVRLRKLFRAAEKLLQPR